MSKNLPRKHSNNRGHACLNCGTPLDISDKYCHQCGQLNTTKRLALKDFFNEFLSNFISYDSKAWRTITHLLFRPGYVTEQYCDGRRMCYANPFRFFLTVSIVFFLIIQAGLFFSDKNTIVDKNQSLFKVDLDDNNSGLLTDEDSIQSKKQVVALLKQQLDSVSKIRGIEAIAHKAILEASIEKITNGEESIAIESENKYTTQKNLDSLSYLNRLFLQLSHYSRFYKKNAVADPQKALARLGHTIDGTNISRYKKAKKISYLENNSSDVLSILLPKITLFLFFFAPFLSLFFWLIYSRGSWSYMEHMVFNFHFLSFIFLILYLIAAEEFVFDSNWIAYIFFAIVGPLYLYKALKKFYQQNRIKTIIKFIMINFAFIILLTLSSSFFMLVSVFASL